MAPVKETEPGSGKFTLTAPAWVLIAILSSGAGIGGVVATNKIAPMGDDDRNVIVAMRKMLDREHEHNEQERAKVTDTMLARMDRMENMLRQSLTSSLECCARVNALERDIDRRLGRQ